MRKIMVNNEKNQTVLTWTGDLTACEKVTFDLTFNPDCEQNGNHANLWTDFKVNEVSKKDITVPLEYCKQVETFEGSGEYITVCEWPIIKYDCK